MFTVLLILTVLIVVWGVGAYNSLISLKNQVANAWKQIDVQLKRETRRSRSRVEATSQKSRLSRDS